MKNPRLRVGVKAMLVALAGAGLLAACAAGSAGRSGNAHVPVPGSPVDLARYAGRWYEFTRYENRFERNCEAVTAEYATRDDGLLSVRNICHEVGIDGPARVSEGRAKVIPDSNNTRLKVSFFGPFFVGDYWILDHADDYSWSIVGEPSGRYLWILTREARPDSAMRAGLIEKVRLLGYDTNMLRETQADSGATGMERREKCRQGLARRGGPGHHSVPYASRVTQRDPTPHSSLQSVD